MWRERRSRGGRGRRGNWKVTERGRGRNSRKRGRIGRNRKDFGQKMDKLATRLNFGLWIILFHVKVRERGRKEANFVNWVVGSFFRVIYIFLFKVLIWMLCMT